MKLTIKHLEKVIIDIQLEEGQEYFGGRQKDCDFILEDETLSRKHIKIYQSHESGNWIIEAISEKGGLSFEGEDIDNLEVTDSAAISLNSYIFEFSVEQKEEEEEFKNPPATEEINKADMNLTNKSITSDGFTKIQPTDSLVYSLHVSVKDESSDHVSLNEGISWTLGRSEDCDIYIDYNALSQKHLNFSRAGDVFTVKDLGSSNGSYLNDEKMTTNKPYALQANDRIVIGDLNIIFEVRNKNFESMMDNLPVAVSEENNHPATLAFPKIVLEESSEEAEEESKIKKLFNKKRIIMFSGVGLLLIGLLFFVSKKENEKQTVKNQKEIENTNTIKESYNLAVQFLQQKKFQFCINELVKLHILIPQYLDSKQILVQCQNSAENQKRYNEMLANDKKKKETEEKVKKLAEECKSKSDTFQTVDDLYFCAKSVLELDPSNAIINAIKLEIEEKNTLFKIAEEKKQSYAKIIRSKKYLYNKAKKINKQKYPLKSIAAYKVFLKSAKGVSGLSSFSRKAKKEVNEIQTNYDNTLSSLYSNCEKFIKEKKMKKAYYECKAILKFKKDDTKSLEYMKLARGTIRNNLKDVYAKSVFEESLANTEAAKKLWKQILEEDLKDGYYYTKAKIFLNRYK